MENRVWNLIDSNTMLSGSNWSDCRSAIRAKVFGKLVELTRDKVVHYESDLYHDATWIAENLNGPMQFDWIARESGTFIGDIVKNIKESDWPGTAKYRFEILAENEGMKWVLNTYQSILDSDTSNKEVSDTGDWREEIPGMGINHYGDAVEAEKSDSTFTEDDRGNWHLVDTDINPINASIDMLFEAPGAVGFPTPRNETTRKANDMDDVRTMLEEKLAELQSVQEDLETAESEIEEAKEINERNIDSVQEAIDALEMSLEDIYISVDISFSS